MEDFATVERMNLTVPARKDPMPGGLTYLSLVLFPKVTQSHTVTAQSWSHIEDSSDPMSII